MKVVILAGGLGTRISEESHLKPKPMIEIGGKPILWHIMKHYSEYGYHDFVICLGYKQYVVKEFFADYFLHTSDVTFDLANNKMEVHNNYAEPWRVTLVDTGLNTQTGARVKRVEKYIGSEPFMLTYGDGVSDIDLNALLAQHRASDKVVTLTGIQPGGRFGVLDLDESQSTVTGFREKAREIMATREKTAQALRALGFTLPDSQANFLFVTHPKVAGETLYRKCKEKGVLIRHFSDPAIAAYNRVTIGTPAEMEAFLAVVQTILKEEGA